jgi:hypothetical protein
MAIGAIPSANRALRASGRCEIDPVPPPRAGEQAEEPSHPLQHRTLLADSSVAGLKPVLVPTGNGLAIGAGAGLVLCVGDQEGRLVTYRWLLDNAHTVAMATPHRTDRNLPATPGGEGTTSGPTMPREPGTSCTCT